MNLDELARLARAATPGRWAINTEHAENISVVSLSKSCEVAWSEDYENAAYIAALSPEVVLRMIAVIEIVNDAQLGDDFPALNAALAALKEA